MDKWGLINVSVYKEQEVAQLVRASAFQHTSVVKVVGLNPAAVY